MKTRIKTSPLYYHLMHISSVFRTSSLLLITLLFSQQQLLAQNYCTPVYNLDGNYIANFTLSVNEIPQISFTANAQTGTSGYDNLSANDAYLITANAGETISFSHTFADPVYYLTDHTLKIWVDWNKDGTFLEDETERMYANYTINATQTGSFDVPIGTLPGNYRMRLRNRWGNNINDLSPCASYGYGQAIDFTLTVPACVTDAGEILGLNTVCQGLNITLTSTETEGTHEWQSKQPLIASIDAISGIVSGLTDGTAEIMYILTTANGCKDTAYHNVTVVEPFIVNITDSPSNDSLLKGTDYTYVSSGTTGTWSSTNVFIASVDPTSGKVTALLAGETDIVYTETHTCLITTLKHLTVYEATPEEDEDDDEDPPTSEPCPNPPCNDNTRIDEIDFVSNVRLFPNPTSNSVKINFTLNDASEVSISVMDLNGKTIETIAVNHVIIGTNTQTLNVVNYANGVYSVVLRSNNSLTIQKLVINK